MYFFCATVLLSFHILHACHTAARNEILGCQEYGIECLSGQATVGSRKSSLKLTRATTEVIAAQQSEVTAKRQRQLEHAVGFANVMQALTTCNKPVVGHNMLLDLAYLYHQFVGHLPPSLDEFRKQVTDQFCQLYDWIRSDQDGLSGFGCCSAVSDKCTRKPQKQTFPVACPLICSGWWTGADSVSCRNLWYQVPCRAVSSISTFNITGGHLHSSGIGNHNCNRAHGWYCGVWCKQNLQFPSNCPWWHWEGGCSTCN